MPPKKAVKAKAAAEVEVLRNNEGNLSTEPVDVLRRDARVAQVVHFTRVFAGALRIPMAPTDRLESALLDPLNHRTYVAELHFRLLRPSPSAPATLTAIDAEWMPLVAKALPELGPYISPEAPAAEAGEAEDVSSASPPPADLFAVEPFASFEEYAALDLERRLRLLCACCQWRLETCPIVVDAVKRSVDNPEYTADCLRMEPCGEDAQGRKYFHFSAAGEDAYLYRESPPTFQKGKRVRESEGEPGLWETVCTTTDDLRALSKTLKASKVRCEKDLSKYISDERAADGVVQLIESTAAARERAEKKQRELEAAPRKRSSRIASIATAKEEEERKRAEDEARWAEEERIRQEQRLIQQAQEEARRREEARQAREAAREAALLEDAIRRERLNEQRERERAERWNKRFKGEENDGSEGGGGIGDEGAMDGVEEANGDGAACMAVPVPVDTTPATEAAEDAPSPRAFDPLRLKIKIKVPSTITAAAAATATAAAAPGAAPSSLASTSDALSVPLGNSIVPNTLDNASTPACSSVASAAEPAAAPVGVAPAVAAMPVVCSNAAPVDHHVAASPVPTANATAAAPAHAFPAAETNGYHVVELAPGVTLHRSPPRSPPSISAAFAAATDPKSPRSPRHTPANPLVAQPSLQVWLSPDAEQA